LIIWEPLGQSTILVNYTSSSGNWLFGSFIHYLDRL
jgi:hypothetical protein